jgi:hypothetical protein
VPFATKLGTRELEADVASKSTSNTDEQLRNSRWEELAHLGPRKTKFNKQAQASRPGGARRMPAVLGRTALYRRLPSWRGVRVFPAGDGDEVSFLLWAIFPAGDGDELALLPLVLLQ